MSNIMKKVLCITICGAPNVGKSTFLNSILQEKVSIVSHTPQTTRVNIRGILNENDTQIIFTDTPGLFNPKNHRKMEHMIVSNAQNAIRESEMALILVDDRGVTDTLCEAINTLKDLNIEYIIAINKIDKIKDNAKILLAEKIYNEFQPRELFFISAKKIESCQKLKDFMINQAKDSPEWLYEPSEGKTDISSEFWLKESIREKLFNVLKKELPYHIFVDIPKLELTNDNFLILTADIYSDIASHTKMIIGKRGEMIKHIVQEVKKDIKENLGFKSIIDIKVKHDAKCFEKFKIELCSI